MVERAISWKIAGLYNFDFDKYLVDDSKTILASLKAELEGVEHENNASDCDSLMDAV